MYYAGSNPVTTSSSTPTQLTSAINRDQQLPVSISNDDVDDVAVVTNDVTITDVGIEMQQQTPQTPQTRRQQQRRPPPPAHPRLTNNHISTKLLATLGLFTISFVVTLAPWSLTLVFCKPGACMIKREDDYTQVMLLVHAFLIPVIYGIRVDQVKERVVSFWKMKFNGILRNETTDQTNTV